VRVYLAGPLFTAAERAFNAALAGALARRRVAVFLPQRDVLAARGAGRTRRLHAGCRRGLEAADLVVAVCDGAQVDDGTAWEIGYAVARGTPVWALRTDPRALARDEALNLMIQESVTRRFRSVPALLRALGRRRAPGARGAAARGAGRGRARRR
jgi:nucleoside 2-deoxyribosyltransferase